MENALLARHLTISDTRELQALQEKNKVYEAQREELELQLKALNNKITETQVKYGTVYNRNASLLSLPNEIVAQIFWFSTAVVQVQGASDSGHDYTLTEVVVSHVCKRWREIALSLPVIWSTFRYCASKCPNPKASLTRLGAYLSRSKHHLLEFWLDLDPRTSEWNKNYDDGYTQLIKAILPHAERWHRVTIWKDTKTDIPYKPFQQINAPHLIHFSFFTTSLPDEEPWINLRDDFHPMILHGGAPNLTSVFFDGFAIASFLPPLNHVTTLRIEEKKMPCEPFASQVAFFEILALPALANLSLIGYIFALDNDAGSWPPSIFMANLTHLRFSLCAHLMYTLTVLEAPLLETLMIKNIDGSCIDHLPGITTAAPFPSLRSLTIDTCGFSANGSGAFMCKISVGITSLLISQKSFEDSILISATDLTGFPEIPWPNLRVASLNTGSIRDIAIYTSFVDRYPGEQALTIRIPEACVDKWKLSLPRSYSTLARKCNIENLTKDIPIQPKAPWPPGYNTSGICTAVDKNFEVEEYYVKNSELSISGHT